MRGGAVACGETLSRNDESSGVRTPVEKELDEDVNGKLGVVVQVVVSETEDNEEYCEESESDQLERLTTDSVYCCNGQPVTRNSTGTGQNGVTGGEVVQLVVYRGTASISNSLEDVGSIEAEAIESNVE